MDRISIETIQEFQQVVKEEYDKDITIEEATIILHDLVEYFSILHKINSRAP